MSDNQQRAAEVVRALEGHDWWAYAEPYSIAEKVAPLIAAAEARGRAEVVAEWRAKVLRFADALAGPPTVAEHAAVRRSMADRLRALAAETSPAPSPHPTDRRQQP